MLRLIYNFDTIQPTHRLLVYYETWRGFDPGVALACHSVSEFIEPAHIYRVKHFTRLFSKFNRDICQVEFIAIAFTQGIDLIKVTDPLGSDQRFYRTVRNRQDIAFDALMARFQKGVPDTTFSYD